MSRGSAYYNEYDKTAAEWLRELIRRGLITDGVVDDRSIADVRPDDVRGFRRVHFFAGIGIWDHALNLAGWGDDEIWTGSCPCQPFSSAGKQRAHEDERHLWPEFFRLIRECRPKHVCGEQVASAAAVGGAARGPGAGDGRVWLDGVFDDLEAAHYACWAADLPAAGIGAPHIRQRLWWWASDLRLANPTGGGLGIDRGSPRVAGHTHECDQACGLADANGGLRGIVEARTLHAQQGPDGHRGSCGLGDAELIESGRNPGAGPEAQGGAAMRSVGDDAGASGPARGLEHTEQSRLEGHAGDVDDRGESGRVGTEPAGSTPQTGGLDRLADAPSELGVGREHLEGRGPQGRATDWRSGSWSSFDVIRCSDGKLRRIPAGAESILQCLAHGNPSGVADGGAEGDRVLQASAGYPLALTFKGRRPLLHGIGNAIVPDVAATFIRASRRVIQLNQT